MELTRKIYISSPGVFIIGLTDDKLIKSKMVQEMFVTEYASGDVWIDMKMCFTHDDIENCFKKKMLCDILFNIISAEVNLQTGDKDEKEEEKSYKDMYIYSYRYGSSIDSLESIDLSFRKFGF